MAIVLCVFFLSLPHIFLKPLLIFFLVVCIVYVALICKTENEWVDEYNSKISLLVVAGDVAQ